MRIIIGVDQKNKSKVDKIVDSIITLMRSVWNSFGKLHVLFLFL